MRPRNATPLRCRAFGHRYGEWRAAGILRTDGRTIESATKIKWCKRKTCLAMKFKET